MIERTYSYKDVEMLMASQTIINSMSTNLSDLSVIRTTWTPEYVTGLQTKISSAINDYLGLDKLKVLREATIVLRGLVEPALKDLAFIKTQIEVDFGPGAKEILTSLGYTQTLHSIDQEGLVQLLYAFKRGMTADLKALITGNGTAVELIDRITGYATTLEQANLTQETMKMASQELSEEAVTIFNEIYKEVIGICKIASKYYSTSPLKKEQFTFSKVVRKMGASIPSEV